MYSGITGEEFAADIYIGCVYYQRLRHMVSDKWQVRTIGKVDEVTRQPVKVCVCFLARFGIPDLTPDSRWRQGRKRGGGVRFGEMERDALLAHGTSFLLQDRLMNCSDYSTAWVCSNCGSIISLGYDEVGLGTHIGFGNSDLNKMDLGPNGEYCRLCRASREKGDEAKNGTNGVGLTLAGRAQLQPKRSGLSVIALPFVFRYLVAELAAMGINLSVGVE
jgi:DNA-directed RNA polymerase I subunit RPA2